MDRKFAVEMLLSSASARVSGRGALSLNSPLSRETGIYRRPRLRQGMACGSAEGMERRGQVMPRPLRAAFG